jgi:hypothetical protein
MESTRNPLPSGHESGTGADMPVFTTNCTCTRCRLGKIHSRLIELALAVPPPFDEQLGELVLDLGAVMLDGGTE